MDGTWSVVIAGQVWCADLGAMQDWTVPVRCTGEVTDAFGLRQASRQPVEIGAGRRLLVAEGAPVNCADLQLNPHGSGTHTECVGHVTRQWRDVIDLRLPPLLPATVITVSPVRLATTHDSYAGTADADDRVVPVGPLVRAVSELVEPGFDQALVLRSCEEEERHRSWSGTNPPYLTSQAMAFLASLPTRHLLLDVPSVDREEDGGSVPNHRAWWGLPEGRDAAAATHPERTITELVHVPPACGDGRWLVSLQVPALELDAAPSRVLAVRPTRPS